MRSFDTEVRGVKLRVYEDAGIEKMSHRKRRCRDGSWFLKHTEKANGYMSVRINGAPVYVHRVVAQAFGMLTTGRHVHHIDGDKSNNCVWNLTSLTPREHQEETGKESSSKYFGVSWSKCAKKWEAHVKLSGKKKGLGLFESEYDAAVARDEAIRKYGINPEFLNFQ
jgi:hypothetical protein